MYLLRQCEDERSRCVQCALNSKECKSYQVALDTPAVNTTLTAATREQLKCLTTAMHDYTAVMSRIGTAESDPTLKAVRETAAIMDPVLDLVESMFLVIANLPKAAVLTYRVFKHNKETQQKLTAEQSRDARGALSSVQNAVAPLRTSCSTLKAILVKAGVAAPKLIAVLDVSATGLGLVSTAGTWRVPLLLDYGLFGRMTPKAGDGN